MKRKGIWRPKKIGQVIAQRQYTVKGHTRRKAFLLEIGRPMKDPDESKGAVWGCPISISGPNTSFFSNAYGGDSMQSLTLGLFHSLQLLHAMAKEKGIEIEYLGPEFPLVYDWWDLKDAERLMKKHFQKHHPPGKTKTKEIFTKPRSKI